MTTSIHTYAKIAHARGIPKERVFRALSGLSVDLCEARCVIEEVYTAESSKQSEVDKIEHQQKIDRIFLLYGINLDL